MITFQGKSVYKGIAIGKLKFHHRESISATKRFIADTESEYTRFTTALNEAKKQLDRLINKAMDEVGKENADIFEIHKLMLEDADYLEYIEKIIKNEALNSEYAVDSAGKFFSERFSSMQDSYMKARLNTYPVTIHIRKRLEPVRPRAVVLYFTNGELMILLQAKPFSLTNQKYLHLSRQKVLLIRIRLFLPARWEFLQL